MIFFFCNYTIAAELLLCPFVYCVYLPRKQKKKKTQTIIFYQRVVGRVRTCECRSESSFLILTRFTFLFSFRFPLRKDNLFVFLYTTPMYKNQYFASVLVYVLSLSRNDPPNPKIPISNNYLIYI